MKFSPDCERIAYVRQDNNLYMYDFQRDRERKLTTTGSETVSNGHFGWLYEEELTGYDKAAIIYDILGDSVAINMFKEIPEAELYELRKHANKIKREISIRVKKDVLDDYYFKMLSAEKDRQSPLNKKMFE